MNTKKDDVRLLQLEKRLDMAMESLNIFLLKDPEEISPREKKLLEKRMKDYTNKKRSNFVELNRYLQSHSA